jgi:hypothetical protein
MHRRSFLAAAAGALAAGAHPATAAKMRASLFVDPANGKWGAELSSRDFSGVLQGLSPSVLDGTVLQVNNPAPATSRAVILTNLPSIATQGVPGSVGSPGSCEAQSFGYCLGAYTAARNPNGSVKWSASDAANQPSAAWLYQWEHQVLEHDARTCPQGSGAKPYADKLVGDGAPSTAAFPYDPHDAATVAAECTYIKGLDVTTMPAGSSRLLVGSYKVYTNVSAADLAHFKELIRHGHAIAFSGLVAKGYGAQSPPLVNGAFTAPQGFKNPSGHGQVIVGYDDSKGPHGAFLVQNSFGPSWNPGPASDHGRNGRIWWDYNAFFGSQKYALIMFPNAPMTNAGTELHASGAGPRFVVANATVRTDDKGRHHLVLVTQASEAVTISELHVVPHAGRHATVKLNETMRLGYQYVTRRGSKAFPPGPCKVAYTVKTRAGATVSYTGTVQVTAAKS